MVTVLEVTSPMVKTTASALHADVFGSVPSRYETGCEQARGPSMMTAASLLFFPVAGKRKMSGGVKDFRDGR
jgi:hypothetical protein